MKNCTIIIFGTTHETNYETTLFEALNKLIKSNKLSNIHWLCEGEPDKRQCTTLKDYTVHLLTDALFVNMLILNMKNDADFMGELYDRIIELFITISRTPHDIMNLINQKYQPIINMLKQSSQSIDQAILTQIEDTLRKIPTDILISDMRQLVSQIVTYYINNIDKSYDKCILDFYNTGSVCEDELMTNLREKSFVTKILARIKTIPDGNSKQYIILTVGEYHCNPLKKILGKLGIRVKIV